MCSQEFPGSIRFLETHFLTRSAVTNSVQYRNRDRHSLIALGNLPRFPGKFWSNSLWRSSLRLMNVPHGFRKGDSSQKSTYRIDWNREIRVFLTQQVYTKPFVTAFHPYSHCRWIEYEETKQSNRGTRSSLFTICDFHTFASHFYMLLLQINPVRTLLHRYTSTIIC